MEPGEVVSYEIEFDLARACIDRRTAYVRYIDPDDECDDDEVDGDQLYYIPLKQPTGTFPIELSIDDVNVLEDETWSIDYACEVDNVQNLYDVDEDGNGDGSFKFIYRPITLANPFPNRSPGTNWKVYTYSSSLQEKMARKNIDYEITIGPQQIASIKSKYTSKYTSLNSITDSGNSTILDELTFKTQTNSYNKLGECTKDCWTIDEGW